MIRIIENINNNQNKLFKCEEKMQQIYNICTNGKSNSYQLLELYGLTKRNMALAYNITLNLAEVLKQYANRLDAIDAIVDMASGREYKVPSSFITDNEIISLNTSPKVIYSLLRTIDEKLLDYEEYERIVDGEKVHTAAANIYKLGKESISIIANKVEAMENADISNFEDDSFLENLANYTILKALKTHNPNECSVLPSDVRAEVIKIFQTGLNIYTTGDIYNLFNMAEQKLFSLSEETKRINAQNLTRKK